MACPLELGSQSSTDFFLFRGHTMGLTGRGCGSLTGLRAMQLPESREAGQGWESLVGNGRESILSLGGSRV